MSDIAGSDFAQKSPVLRSDERLLMPRFSTFIATPEVNPVAQFRPFAETHANGEVAPIADHCSKRLIKLRLTSRSSNCGVDSSGQLAETRKLLGNR